MNIIFDPINSIITFSLKEYSYTNIEKYLNERGFFFPIISDTFALKNRSNIETFKSQSPLNFIFSVFIKNSGGEIEEIGKRILKSSSGYRLASLYLYEGCCANIAYVSVKIYSNEIAKEFGAVHVELSKEDREILSLL